jgi:hypothetical protein
MSFDTPAGTRGGRQPRVGLTLRQPSGMTAGDFLRKSRDIIRMAAAW